MERHEDLNYRQHERQALIGLICCNSGKSFKKIFNKNKDRVSVKQPLFGGGPDCDILYSDIINGRLNSNYKRPGEDFPNAELKYYDCLKTETSPSISNINQDCTVNQASDVNKGKVLQWHDWDDPRCLLSRKCDIVIHLVGGDCILDALVIKDKEGYVKCLKEYYIWATNHFNYYKGVLKTNPHDFVNGYFYCKPTPSGTNLWQFTNKGMRQWFYSVIFDKSFTDVDVRAEYTKLLAKFPGERFKRIKIKETYDIQPGCDVIF